MIAWRAMAAILALVLTLLGLVFTTVGLASSGSDAEGFATVGPALLAVGLALAALSWWLFRRAQARARRRREGERAMAEIVEARLHPAAVPSDSGRSRRV